MIGQIKELKDEKNIPKGWWICDGRELPIMENKAKFEELKNSYGGLPDMRPAKAVIYLGI